MCPVDAETVGHFLLGCSISRVLRALIFSQLVFASWDSTSKDGSYLPPPPKKKKKKEEKRLEVERVLSILPCLKWFNWLQRNKRVFECKL
jgi:hypothetical protein